MLGHKIVPICSLTFKFFKLIKINRGHSTTVIAYLSVEIQTYFMSFQENYSVSVKAKADLVNGFQAAVSMLFSILGLKNLHAIAMF